MGEDFDICSKRRRRMDKICRELRQEKSAEMCLLERKNGGKKIKKTTTSSDDGDITNESNKCASLIKKFNYLRVIHNI